MRGCGHNHLAGRFAKLFRPPTATTRQKCPMASTFSTTCSRAITISNALPSPLTPADPQKIRLDGFPVGARAYRGEPVFPPYATIGQICPMAGLARTGPWWVCRVWRVIGGLQKDTL